MGKQIDRMKNIIADLMDTTRFEHGAIKLQKQSFDFNELLNEIVDEVQQTTSLHKIRVQGKAKNPVVADIFRVGQVITNLLSNAVRYSPDNKDIHVKVTSDDKYVTCIVRDFGVGIPHEQQEMIFERFYRVKDIERVDHMGLGLGLYLCREIIELHNGKIWVESEGCKENLPASRQGSTFSFTLPVE